MLLGRASPRGLDDHEKGGQTLSETLRTEGRVSARTTRRLLLAARRQASSLVRRRVQPQLGTSSSAMSQFAWAHLKVVATRPVGDSPTQPDRI
jgi:hypothetical protein